MSIEIRVKDETVGWNKIHDCLWAAHSDNRKNGIILKTTLMTPEELEVKVNEEGTKSTTFIALDGEKVVGTGTISFHKINKWFHKGIAAHQMLMGVDPQYQGQGIYSRLDACRNALIKEEGVNVIYFGTAEGNKIKQKIALAEGFKYVDFLATPSCNHYSVIMAKWENKCPYSNLHIKLMYMRLKLKTKFIYKPGKIKRF